MQPLKKEIKKILQLLKNCIGPTIRIGRESWCLPYAGFFHTIIGFDTHIRGDCMRGLLEQT